MAPLTVTQQRSQPRNVTLATHRPAESVEGESVGAAVHSGRKVFFHQHPIRDLHRAEKTDVLWGNPGKDIDREIKMYMCATEASTLCFFIVVFSTSFKAFILNLTKAATSTAVRSAAAMHNKLSTNLQISKNTNLSLKFVIKAVIFLTSQMQ